MENDTGYFSMRSVPYAGGSWTFADARNVLLVVYGLTERSGRLVLIRQYRPPVAATVLSADGVLPGRGCPGSAGAGRNGSRGGNRALRIEYLLSFARSPVLTTELARCFVVSYAEEAGPR